MYVVSADKMYAKSSRDLESVCPILNCKHQRICQIAGVTDLMSPLIFFCLGILIECLIGAIKIMRVDFVSNFYHILDLLLYLFKKPIKRTPAEQPTNSTRALFSSQPVNAKKL